MNPDARSTPPTPRRARSRRIAQRFPDARTLYMTAWSGDALPVTMQRYAAVLDKPFTTDSLLSAVRTALDRPTA